MKQIKGENFEIDLVKGRVRLGLYSPEEKASLQVSVKLPDQQAGEAKGVLGRVSALLGMAKTAIDGVKDELEQGEDPG